MITTIKDYEEYLYTVGTEEGPHCLAFGGDNKELIPSFVFNLREQIKEDKKKLSTP